MTFYNFNVDGIEPAPQGSKTYLGGGRLIESCKRVKSWRSLVYKVAGKFIKTPIEGPCEVKLVFKLKRRKSDFNSKGQVKKKAPQHYVIKKNDLDKLVRSTLDGLTGVAYKDDCQVIRILASKRYADFEDVGAEIFIHALDI